EIVALTSYVFNNYKLLAVSDIGEQYDPETEEGTLGKNYSYQLHSGATGFFEEKKFNTFMGAGALGMAMDDYNGDNFDHTDLDFIHGGLIDQLQMGADPESSVVNNWLQHWDRDNLFAVSAGSYAHMSGYNATLTVGALAYRCAEGIIEYSKSPGRLES